MRVVVFLGAILLSVGLQAQGGLLDKFYFGGGFGFNISESYTSFNVTPYGAYKITDRWSAGIGLNYQYAGYKHYDIQIDNYGGNVFTRFMLLRNVFASAKFEYLNVEVYNLNDLTSEREGFFNMPVGLGYVMPLGKVASFYVIGQYDLMYQNDVNGPYDSPWILEAGFGVGF